MSGTTVKSLSIVNLLQQQFGVKPLFDPELEQVPARVAQNRYGTAYYTTDEFGREVFLPITFKYTDEQGIVQEFVLHHAVVGIRGRNTIVKTPLTERAGTFKEQISGDDWIIDIKGFLIKGSNDLPEDKVNTLVTLKRQRTSISLKNALTDLVLKTPDSNGTDLVVIEELDFPAVVGKIDHKPFVLMLASDTPFNLEEIE